MIKLAVFDLDGTLIDAFQDIADAANYILRSNGRPELSVEEVKQFVGKGARVLVQGILGTDDPAVIEPNYQKLVRYYESAEETRATFYPGILEAVDTLRASGVRTAVISNKPDSVTKKVMEVMGAREKFDYIHGESPRFPRKPAPDAMWHVMEEAGVKPEETIMVGDTAVDLEFARASGVRMIAVPWGQTTAEQFREIGVETVISRAEDLVELVRREA